MRAYENDVVQEEGSRGKQKYVNDVAVDQQVAEARAGTEREGANKPRYKNQTVVDADDRQQRALAMGFCGQVGAMTASVLAFVFASVLARRSAPVVD